MLPETLRVTRKELHGFFSSPVAYIFLGTFLLVSLFIFFWAEAFFARNIADVRPLFEWLPLLLTLPLPLTVSTIGPLDWGPVWGGYLASLFLGAAYLAIGLYLSARSDNQIVSLISTVLVCGIFYLLGSDLLTSFSATAPGNS